MKIIDLLNKIANGEEVPSKIEYRNIRFLYDKNNKLYIVENYNEYNDLLMELSNHKGTDLNYEVEIIEEKPTQEEIKEYTNKFLEAWIPVKKQFGKLFDEIARLEDELDEDKDIPLIPDDELYDMENIDDFSKSYKYLAYNFKVLKEKINQLVEEFNEYRKENK